MPRPPYNMRVLVMRNDLPKISKKWRDETQVITQETAEELARRATDRAPVASSIYDKAGYLKGTIKAIQRGGNRLQWAVIVTASFARHVEFGTKNTKAQPFLIPAWEEMRREYEDRITRMLNDIPSRSAA